MVSEKELHRTTLGANQLRDDKREHRYSLPPTRRTRVARVSRSVDRDSTTATSFDYASTRPSLRLEHSSPALPKPSWQRRFSLSAITTRNVAGRPPTPVRDDTYLTADDFYDAPSKNASLARWSRKDVVYTAENMGFSHERPPRHTAYTRRPSVSNVPRTNVDVRQRRSRIYFADDYDDIHTLGADGRRRIKLRASSVPRTDTGVIRYPRIVGDAPILHRRANSVTRTQSAAGVDRSRLSYSSYGATAAVRTEDHDGLDIASFVLAPGEKFIPTNVSVSVLPSGKRAVTYTRFSQKGTGDQHKANVEIDHVIQRTNRLQVSIIFQIVLKFLIINKATSYK